MNRSLRLWLMVLCFAALQLPAAQMAGVRMYCWSVRFSQGHDGTGLYSLDLSMLDSSINGELLPLSGASTTHGSGLYLTDETLFDEPVPGTLYLNVPDYPAIPDSNDDGFNDFFDVSRGVSATTSGTFSFQGYTSGQVTAKWSRAAGSRTGTCVLTLKINSFQSLGDFTHTFEILEYKGTLNYVPNASSVTGLVAMVQTGWPENLLQGQLVFRKSLANPSNELELQPGSLTNQTGQTLVHWEDVYSREPAWPTNYYGFVTFVDGDLSTSEVDYDLWLMSVDDMNDADKDKIPDFSDTPAAAVRRPVLTLSKTGTGLSLTISTDIGTSWEVQHAPAINGSWTVASTVAITSDPQTLELPVPASDRFYRLKKL